MIWECTECGGLSEQSRMPRVCPCCGLAGALFVHTEKGLELDPASASLREAWLHAGLEATELLRGSP
jgi:hypothetical protein